MALAMPSVARNFQSALDRQHRCGRDVADGGMPHGLPDAHLFQRSVLLRFLEPHCPSEFEAWDHAAYAPRVELAAAGFEVPGELMIRDQVDFGAWWGCCLPMLIVSMSAELYNSEWRQMATNNLPVSAHACLYLF